MSGDEVRGCPLCGRDNSACPRLSYAAHPWVLRECAGCGLVYLENPPPYEALEADLAWEKTWAAEHERRLSEEPVFGRVAQAINWMRAHVLHRDKLSELILRYVAPGPVLDVGCADGRALDRLPAGYIPFGIEVSRELHALADARFSRRGGRALRADALSGMQQLSHAFFEGIVMCSFLEHERQPRQALERAALLLKPGARLILKVPNFACWNRAVRGARWCGFRSPDHVNYFTPRLLARLVSDCGLKVRRFGPFDRFPTSDNMWLVAEK
ncbi:MAG TPA: class I SAM-dependent methyltransferase [Terriglobales bacterium]|nr:class I SAM-dependent methyltransferase [Terriglobales bacterium]